MPSTGERFAGRYLIEEVLGQGGTGVVLAARDLELRRRVAIKFLLPEARSLPHAAERFLREARATAALGGEHVARVLDLGKGAGGAPYLVLEHLTGTDLRQVLEARGPLPIEQAVDYTLQACEAVAEAHSLGILHRDLKPSNLFLADRPDGSKVIKVLDFGLSKATDATGVAVLTTTDMVAGSPHAMSPEQVRSLKHVDARTDVWALGVILHHLLSGRPPFDGETITATLAMILTDPPRPLRALRPEVPAGLEEVVLGCLQKEVGARLASVAALASALAPYGSPGAHDSAARIERLASRTRAELPLRELDPGDSSRLAEAAGSDPPDTRSFQAPPKAAPAADAHPVATVRGARGPTRLARSGSIVVAATAAILLATASLMAWRARSPAEAQALAAGEAPSPVSARELAPAGRLPSPPAARGAASASAPAEPAAPGPAEAAGLPRASTAAPASGSVVAPAPPSKAAPSAPPRATGPRGPRDPMDRWQ